MDNSYAGFFSWLDRTIPPGLQGEDLRKSRILMGFNLVSLLIFAGLVSRQMSTPEGLHLYFVVILFLLLSMAVANVAVLWWKKSVQAAAALMLLELAIGIGLLIAFSGGLASRSMPSMALFPLLGFFLLGLRMGTLFALLFLLEGATFAALTIAGVKFPDYVTGSTHSRNLITFVNIFSITVFMGWLYETSRMRAMQALKVSLEENKFLQVKTMVAQEANQAKSQFLAMMSHELRTPLNAIIGYTEILQEEAEEESLDAFQGDLTKILQSSEHLLLLLQDMLDLSSLESGDFSLQVSTSSLSEVLHELLDGLGPFWAKAGNKFVCIGPEESLEMRSDPQRLKQVLFHLLSNAAKFTKQGHISLEVKETNVPGDSDEKAISFAVSDDGVGIPESLQGEIFAMFQQGDGSSTRKHGGVGMGLSIAEKMSKALGGTIALESEEGSGSTFTLIIPQILEEP